MALYPFLRSPFTDIGSFMFNSQQTPNMLCAKFEMQILDCYEAYGLDMGKRKCADLLHDYQECMFRKKEDERTIKLQYERHRQYYSGEREKHFEPPPKMNAW